MTVAEKLKQIISNSNKTENDKDAFYCIFESMGLNPKLLNNPTVFNELYSYFINYKISILKHLELIDEHSITMHDLYPNKNEICFSIKIVDETLVVSKKEIKSNDSTFVSVSTYKIDEETLEVNKSTESSRVDHDKDFGRKPFISFTTEKINPGGFYTSKVQQIKILHPKRVETIEKCVFRSKTRPIIYRTTTEYELTGERITQYCYAPDLGEKTLNVPIINFISNKKEALRSVKENIETIKTNITKNLEEYNEDILEFYLETYKNYPQIIKHCNKYTGYNY